MTPDPQDNTEQQPASPVSDEAAAEQAELAEAARFETELENKQPRLLVVPVLAAINVLVWVLFSMAGDEWVGADSQLLIAWGSNAGQFTLDGQWWRMLSATILHAGVAHLLSNMIALLDFGSRCERFYGSRAFLALYLLSALAGSAVSLMWSPLGNSVGASGAIMGVLGAALVYTLDGRNDVPVSIFKQHATSLGIFLFYTVMIAINGGNIDHAAHFGGLVMGIIAGIILLPSGDVDAGDAPARRRHLTTGFWLLMCLAGVVGVTWMANLGAGSKLDYRVIDSVNSLESRERDFRKRIDVLLPVLADTKTRGDAVTDLRRLADWARMDHADLVAFRLKPDSRWKEAHALLTAFAADRVEALEALIAMPAQMDISAQVAAFEDRMKASAELAGRIKAARDQAVEL